MRKKASSWYVLGGVDPIPVRSLGAGGDKGETARLLPLSLSALVLQSLLSCGACWFFVVPYVVLIVVSFLVLVLSLSCLFFAWPALRLSSSSCLGLGFVS